MPWVEFWSGGIYGHCEFSREHMEYDWYPGDRLNKESLEDEARERVPSYIQGTERGYRCGFNILKELPSDVREKLIKEARSSIEVYVRRLARLLNEG